jgi:LEA14-like dessication related protein
MGIAIQPSLVQFMVDKKQMENVKFVNCFGSTITNGERCTCKINARILMARGAFSKNKTLVISNLT